MSNSTKSCSWSFDSDKQPLISIIVPVYKVEKYLNECIKSIVNQTYHNLEIILVDDGSLDNCGRMCDDWAAKDARIRVIHKENGGLSDARNKGMEASSGAYIAHIDSDDVVEAVYIEYLFKALIESDADFSECLFQVFKDSPYRNNQILRMPDIVILSQEDLLNRFDERNRVHYPNVWNKLYKRELIKEIPFAVGYQAQDLYFTCQVYGQAKTAAHIDVVLYYYRNRPDNATNAFFKQRSDAYEMLYQCLQYLEQNHPSYVKDFKAHNCSFILSTANWYVLASPSQKRTDLMNLTNSYRRKIKITKEEWSQSSRWQKLRYICSLPGINVFSMRIRHLLIKFKIIKI